MGNALVYLEGQKPLAIMQSMIATCEPLSIQLCHNSSSLKLLGGGVIAPSPPQLYAALCNLFQFVIKVVS